MPVPQSVLDQFKDDAPEQPPSTQRAQKGFSLIDSAVEGGKELASSFATGLARGADFPKALLAGVLMPFIPEGDTPGAKAVYSILKPSMETLSPETKQRAEHPKTVVGKVLGDMAEGVGGIASMPIPGGTLGQAIVRNVISGAGMGEGSMLGKFAGGGLAGAIDPSYRESGEVAGSILGGGLGAQANIMRAAAIGEAAKTPVKAIGNIKPAYDAAREKQAAQQSLPKDQQQRLWELFADEFGSLRASTRGIIGQYTNQELASSISRDITAMSRAKNFDEEIAQSGAKLEIPMKGKDGQEELIRPWGLGERTMVPAITRMTKERIPKNFDEGTNIDVRTKARQKSITDAYDSIAGEKPIANEQGAEAAGRLLQKVTQEKVDALTAEQTNVRDKFPEINSKQEFDLGQSLRDRRDALNKESLAVAKQKYGEAEKAFDDEGVKIGVEGIRQNGKAILDEFIAKANPGEIPPVVKSIMGATKTERPESLLILPEGVKPAPPEPTTISLADANDLSRALSRMATDYRQQNRFQEMDRAIRLRNEVSTAIEDSSASPEAKQAYNEARRYWAEEHAPRFREDIGKALGEEKGGAFQGSEAVTSEKVMDRFMGDETGMREFDRIYGNDPTAKTALRNGLEGRFRDQVLNGANTPEQLEIRASDFNNKYESVLDRFPQLQEKIDERTGQTLYMMREKQRELERYKDLMKGPVTQAIGPVQAKVLYGNVLSDPVKMDKLLASIPKDKGDVAKQMVKELFIQANPMKSGSYDATALVDMLAAGKNNNAMQSSIEKLFEAAYGKELGKHHMKSLEALSELSMREAATNPSNIRSGSLLSESPVRDTTGQSMASWISAWRQQEAGATGSGYFSILGLSRFANAKAQAAVEKAKLEALYDPDTADAILEMARTPINKPLGKSVAAKIFGNITTEDGKRLIDKLTDKGYIDKHFGRGVLYGTEHAMTDQQEKQRRALPNFSGTTLQ